jgi:Polyketide cyclase / dehydrase and lipid transport
MATASLEHIFSVPAHDIWALIGDFGDTGKWSGRPPEACVQNGVGIGALRTLTLADGRQIVDRLDAIGLMSYTYSIVQSPLPVASYTATMMVEAIDEASCRFSWSGNFVPTGISDEQAVVFFEDVYRSGLAMIEKALSEKMEGDTSAHHSNESSLHDGHQALS